MALIHCPECGKQHSDQADSCPACGLPKGRKPVEHAPPTESSNSDKSSPKFVTPWKKLSASQVKVLAGTSISVAFLGLAIGPRIIKSSMNSGASKIEANYINSVVWRFDGGFQYERGRENDVAAECRGLDTFEYVKYLTDGYEILEASPQDKFVERGTCRGTMLRVKYKESTFGSLKKKPFAKLTDTFCQTPLGRLINSQKEVKKLNLLGQETTQKVDAFPLLGWWWPEAC